jgi:hypothetical protein
VHQPTTLQKRTSPWWSRLLCAIAIALATLAIARILARHPRCHRHFPLHCRCRCLPANLVTVSITLLPSPSSLLATLIAATVLATAIDLVVACPAPLLPSPLLLQPSPLPLSSLATLVAVVFVLFVASAFNPPLLLLCRLAAVGVCVAGVNLLAEQRQWRRRRHANSGGGGGSGNAATN